MKRKYFSPPATTSCLPNIFNTSFMYNSDVNDIHSSANQWGQAGILHPAHHHFFVQMQAKDRGFVISVLYGHYKNVWGKQSWTLIAVYKPNGNYQQDLAATESSLINQWHPSPGHRHKQTLTYLIFKNHLFPIMSNFFVSHVCATLHCPKVHTLLATLLANVFESFPYPWSLKSRITLKIDSIRVGGYMPLSAFLIIRLFYTSWKDWAEKIWEAQKKGL